MKHLCVILGAGASYDMVGTTSQSPSRINPGWKPPLTSDLFAQRSQFEGVLANSPAAYPLVHRLRTLVAGSPDSLESLLGQIASSDNSRESLQLRYLTYYLRQLLFEVSRNYVQGSPTNYDALVDVILRRDISVMFLTLNYDLFLEKTLESLEQVRFRAVTNYIPSGSPWRLIKLHGSANWGRRISGKLTSSDRGALEEIIRSPHFPLMLSDEIEIFESADVLSVVEDQLV